MHKSPNTPQHAWQRWLPLWYGLFYLALVFTTFLALYGNSRPLRSSLLLLGLSGLLGIWYGVWMLTNAQAWSRRVLPAMGYLAIGWALWFALTLLSLSYILLLFGLYPQIYLFRPLPWKLVGALILTALTIARQVLLPGGINGSLFIILTAAAGGTTIALFIEAIIRQSLQRAKMLHEMEETRHELAIAQLQAGITRERQRLAHEIHDTLVQGFTSIVMHLEAVEGAFPDDRKMIQRHLDQARRMARENLAEARRLIWALQPEAFDHASLSEVLINLAREWSEDNGTAFSVAITGTPRPLRPEIEVALLRAAQETLANVSKHAHAGQVIVTLSYMEDVVALDVQDDGIGFDTAQPPNSAHKEAVSGFGLVALRKRAEQLGGTLSIESTPGEGTTVAMALPAISSESLRYSESAQEVRQ